MKLRQKLSVASYDIMNNNRLFFLLSIVFLLTRIVFLDSDLPPFDVFNYQPIDELWYNNSAFNLFHYSDIQHKVLPFVESDSITPNLFGNLISFLTLMVFGNNYYGLRMASVIASFGVFVLFFFVLKNYLKRDESQPEAYSKHFNLIIFSCLVYLICDFPFLLAGRVAEPTIFRMLSMVFLLYLVSVKLIEKHAGSKRFTFLAGFAAFTTVLYVYPSNAFIVPAAWIVCIYTGWNLGFKRGAVHTVLFLLGGILCLISYEITLKVLFGKSYVDQIAVYSVFIDRVNLPVAGNDVSSLSLVKKFILNIFGTFSTNIFRLNPIVLVLFLGSLPIFIFNVKKRKSLTDLFLAALLFFFFLQLVFINDYYYRKLVFMLPMVLLVIASSVVGYNSFYAFIIDKKVLFYFKLYLFLVICFGLIIFLLNCYEPLIGKDVISDQRNILLGAFILQLLFVFTTYKKIPSRYFASIILILVLISGLYLGARYIYFNPTYSYKNTMIKLSQYVNGEIVVGGLVNGFRLYNTSVPVLDAYGYKFTEAGRRQYKILRDKIIKEQPERYTILINGSGGNLFYVGNEAYDCKVNLVFLFYLNNTDESIGLYRYQMDNARKCNQEDLRLDQ